MARRCVFCGSADVTAEHVMPAWLSRLGIDHRPTVHESGWINRSPRRWTGAPFGATIRLVCRGCNTGWLSRLEARAKTILSPLIVGRPAKITIEDQRIIAAWAHKTVLVAMLAYDEK